MDPKDLCHLQNPPTHKLNLNNSPDIQFVIELFLTNYNNPIHSFNSICKALLHHYPEKDVYTYGQTKQFVRHLTGIVPLSHDICVNACIVYIGPLTLLECHPHHLEPHYNLIVLRKSGGKKKKAWRVFHTL